MLKEGTKAPAFCLPSAESSTVCLQDFAGKRVVVYFYPKAPSKGHAAEVMAVLKKQAS